VSSAVPLKVSTLLRVKPAPVAFSVTAGPPPGAELGSRAKRTGDTLKAAAVEVATAGCETVIGKVPESARNSGGMAP
jgi:hypothetical protein